MPERVVLLQRNSLPALFPGNRGNVGTNKEKRLKTLIWKALGAIKSCGDRLGTRWEQSGNIYKYIVSYYFILFFSQRVPSVKRSRHFLDVQFL